MWKFQIQLGQYYNAAHAIDYRILLYIEGNDIPLGVGLLFNASR